MLLGGAVRVASRVGVLLLAVAAVAGCTAGPIPEPTASTAPAYVIDYEPPAPTALAPLTGAVVPVGSLAHPSLAAKVDNHPEARPQVGLSSTDIVFEELVEGGLTRYVAVWQSNVPAEIGPVRSIRPMDPDIISPLGGIVAYSGGQQRFVAMMRATNVYNAIHGQSDTASTFFRTSTKDAPHNVLVKAPELIAQHADLAPPQQLFAFADSLPNATAASSGGPTASMSLVFGSSSHPSWSWDAAAGVWRRFQDGVPDMDNAGGQLSAVNVAIVRVAVANNGGVPQTVLTGAGEAWVATGGKMVHASWNKGSATQPIRFIDDTGTVVRFAPGNTWVELVPNSGSVAFAAG